MNEPDWFPDNLISYLLEIFVEWNPKQRWADFEDLLYLTVFPTQYYGKISNMQIFDVLGGFCVFVKLLFQRSFFMFRNSIWSEIIFNVLCPVRCLF